MPSNTDFDQLASEARQAAQDLDKLADELRDAAMDCIGQGDVSLLGLYSAEAFIREHKATLERMG